ncbi:MAG: hypothetical protein HY907_00480 [Deltaproteobacteria bacterium]|nr:hypothetical protein [Deltaproteobacteria bacterium]
MPSRPPSPSEIPPPWASASGNDRECPYVWSDEGCSVGHAPRAVFGVQLLLFLVGPALYRRRRRSR